MRVHDSGGPLAHEKAPVPLDDEGDKATGRGGFAFAEVGQFGDAVFPEGDAEFFDRANPALRISRRADQRAEFHQGLVKCGAESCWRSSRRKEAPTLPILE